MASRPIILDHRAQALARYPHARVVPSLVGDLIHVSGISSRRPQAPGEATSWDGVVIHPDGRVEKDIAAQTEAVLKNIDVILQAAGASLAHAIDITVFLVDMKDYAGMNAVWDRFFPDPQTAPARTTVAVHQLPHQNLLVEMKAVAFLPAASAVIPETP